MPSANDVVFNRNDPNHMLLRTTFGFLQTRDGGENWSWICERSTGNPDNLAYDPPMALTADGTSVISVTFGGVTTSGDFCDWAPTPAVLATRLVVDSTWIPNDPAGALLLTSDLPQGETEYRNYIWETRDNARTWVQKGVRLRPQSFLMTLEVAPSDLNRIYVTGVEYETLADGTSRRVGWLFRSDDAGATWTNRELSLPDDPAAADGQGAEPCPLLARATLESSARDASGCRSWVRWCPADHSDPTRRRCGPIRLTYAPLMGAM
jgi:hypothetical protein